MPHSIVGLLGFGAAAGGVWYLLIGGLHRAMDWLDERKNG